MVILLQWLLLNLIIDVWIHVRALFAGGSRVRLFLLFVAVFKWSLFRRCGLWLVWIRTRTLGNLLLRELGIGTAPVSVLDAAVFLALVDVVFHNFREYTGDLLL